MNIFILDNDISKCAEYHCDQHAIKMILESVQMLCTALNKRGESTPYKSTHMNHPCVLWVEKSYDNFEWLAQLAVALNDEYRFRFDKSQDHKSISALRRIEKIKYQRNGITPFAQAMPDQYKVQNRAVKAYRQFYLGEKMHFARWTKRDLPDWVKASSEV